MVEAGASREEKRSVWPPKKPVLELLKLPRKDKRNLKNLQLEGLQKHSWLLLQNIMLAQTKANQFLSGRWGEVALFCLLLPYYIYKDSCFISIHLSGIRVSSLDYLVHITV